MPATAASSIAELAHVRSSQPPVDSPFVTFHDDVTGERTELGYATFENWVAKSANLLVEEFQVARGDRVALLLGTHWTTAVLAFACWRIGACVVPGDRSSPADALRALLTASGATVVVVEEAVVDLADALPAGAGLLAVGSGMGGRLTHAELPDGALAFGDEVPAFADDYDGRLGEVSDDALLALPGVGKVGAGKVGAGQVATQPVRHTQRTLLAAAETIRRWGVSDDDRLLVTRPPTSVDGLVLGVLAPWVVGGSVVVVRDPDPGALWAKVATERATLALTDATVLDRLPAPGAPHGLAHLLVPDGAAREVVRRAEKRLGTAVAVGHGVAEAVCVSTLTPAHTGPEVSDWLARCAAPTVGVATSGTDVAILGAGARPVDDGDRGEICVRGAVVTPEVGEGWLHTGDEGFVDTGPDGNRWVFVTGAITR